MSVTSPGATDLRVAMIVDLPPGGEIRFFGTYSGDRFSVVTRIDITWSGADPQVVWSPVVKR